MSPRVSADGRRVIFASFADNLVPGDRNGERDVFAYDRETGRIEAVTVAGPRPHVVYFAAAPSAGDGAVLTPDALRRHFDDLGYRYTEARAWPDVLAADGEARVDVLVLDPGSLPRVDGAWVRERAGRAIVLAGVNVRQRALESLLGDATPSGADESYPGEFSSVVSQGRTSGDFGSPVDRAETDGDIPSDGPSGEAEGLMPLMVQYGNGFWSTGTESAVPDAEDIETYYGEAFKRAGIRWEPWHLFFQKVGQVVGRHWAAEMSGASGVGAGGS